MFGQFTRLEQTPRRHCIDMMGLHGHDFHFRVPESGQTVTENASRIDIESPVDPDGIGDRRVSIDDVGSSPILACPIHPNRQSSLVDLTGGDTEKCNSPNGRGIPALIFLR